jgi:hypothetical protein
MPSNIWYNATPGCNNAQNSAADTLIFNKNAAGVGLGLISQTNSATGKGIIRGNSQVNNFAACNGAGNNSGNYSQSNNWNQQLVADVNTPATTALPGVGFRCVYMP